MPNGPTLDVYDDDDDDDHHHHHHHHDIFQVFKKKDFFGKLLVRS
jgi:hypothetical protein